MRFFNFLWLNLFIFGLLLPQALKAQIQERSAPPMGYWQSSHGTSATADGACRLDHAALNPLATFLPPEGSTSYKGCKWIALQNGGPPGSNTTLPGFVWLVCPGGTYIYEKNGKCVDRRTDSANCDCEDPALAVSSGPDPSLGDPVSIASGYLTERETDYESGDGLLKVSRKYTSSLYMPYPGSLIGFGQVWQGLIPGKLLIGDGRMTTIYYTGRNGGTNHYVVADDNLVQSWVYNNDTASRLHLRMVTVPTVARDAYFVQPPVINGPAEFRLDFGNGEYILYRRGPVEGSTRQAIPIERGDPSGYRQFFDYPDTGIFPNLVRDSFGRQMALTWIDAPRDFYSANPDAMSKVISTISLPDGTTLRYNYDKADWSLTGAFTDTGDLPVKNTVPGMKDRLTGVIRTDAQGATIWKRSYVYGDERWPYALTAIKDTNDVEVSSFTYDQAGYVRSSAAAGNLNRYEFAELRDPNDENYVYRDVTNPLGLKTRYTTWRDVYYAKAYTPRSISRIESAATANVPARVENVQFVGPFWNTMVAGFTDANGNQTNYALDAGNDRPNAVTEAAGTPQQRTKTITWHPTLDLPAREEIPGLRTDYSYSPTGQVLSRTETDTTVQTVPYLTAGQARTWTYFWSSAGRLLGANGPKSLDLNGKDDTLSYVYDAAGNLQSSTNGLGLVTRFGSYDVNGRPGTMTDPNLVVTAFTYDVLGRVRTTSVKHPTTVLLDALTTFDYDVENRVVGITPPATDKMFIDYNLGGQLIAIRMASGERIDYQNDVMGNVTGQTVKRGDASAARTITRTFDEIGRMLTVTLGPGRTTQLAYDANGNPTRVTSARNSVTQTAFDPLNRLASTVAPDTGTTALVYDASDTITSHTDPTLVQTTFVRNGFGDAIQEVSPDRGTSTYYYDAAGAVTASIDGRGQRIDIVRDALGRITKKTPVGRPTTEIVTYAYDTAGIAGSYGVERLSSVIDGTGTTRFAYDHRGNLITKQQKIGTTTAANLRYTYDLADRILQITYPSGRLVAYARDTKGRVMTVQTKATAGTASWTTLASGVTYEPWGSMKSTTLGNGLTMTQNWGNDGRLASKRLYKTSTGVDLSLLTYGYDNDDNIVAITDGVTAANTVQYGYDVNGRLTQSVAASGTVKRLDTLYDKNGNRTAVQQRTNATDATPVATDTYATTAGKNRLASITTSAGLRSITYDARGNTLSETRPASKTVAATYDGYGRLLTYSRTGDPAQTNVYNGVDDRVSVTSGSTTRKYLYDGDGRLLGEYGASATAPVAETIWLSPEVASDNQPIGGDDGVGGYAPLAVAVGSGSGLATQWVHGNHLGVPLVTTNASGVAIVPTGYTLPGFPGQTRTLSDIYYNRYRDYDSSTGRYIQADPIGLGGGANAFLYANGNPIRYIDPSGKLPVPVVTGLIGGAAGAIADLGIQLIRNNFALNCVDLKQTGIAFGVGFTSGALAPYVAITRSGAVLLGAGSNLTQYLITHGRDSSLQGAILSAAAGAVGGAIGGPIAKPEFTHDTFYPVVDKAINDGATIAVNATPGAIARGTTGAVVSGIPNPH